MSSPSLKQRFSFIINNTCSTSIVQDALKLFCISLCFTIKMGSRLSEFLFNKQRFEAESELLLSVVI